MSTQAAAETINAIEGFLLNEAEKHQARLRAQDFSARLPWLTDSQREEIERLYADDHLRTWRTHLQRVAHRTGELRTEYETRYRTLKLRLLTAALLSGAALASTALAALLGR